MKRIGREDEGDSDGSKGRDRLFWLYIVLVLGVGMVVLDMHLEPRLVSSSIARSHVMEVNISSTRHRQTAYWTLITLVDGTTFQTERTLGGFSVGTAMVVEVSPLLHRSLRYRWPSHPESPWITLEADSLDLRPFPYLVWASALLLLFPWRRIEIRWSLQLLLVVLLIGWLFALFGTGGFARFY